MYKIIQKETQNRTHDHSLAFIRICERRLTNKPKGDYNLRVLLKMFFETHKKLKT